SNGEDFAGGCQRWEPCGRRTPHYWRYWAWAGRRRLLRCLFLGRTVFDGTANWPRRSNGIDFWGRRSAVDASPAGNWCSITSQFCFASGRSIYGMRANVSRLLGVWLWFVQNPCKFGYYNYTCRTCCSHPPGRLDCPRAFNFGKLDWFGNLRGGIDYFGSCSELPSPNIPWTTGVYRLRLNSVRMPKWRPYRSVSRNRTFPVNRNLSE